MLEQSPAMEDEAECHLLEQQANIQSVCYGNSLVGRRDRAGTMRPTNLFCKHHIPARASRLVLLAL